jgi:hypothetical protein
MSTEHQFEFRDDPEAIRIKAQRCRSTAVVSIIEMHSSMDSAAAEIARLRSALTEEVAIVNRIWAQLGSPTFDDLKGRSIYDLIDELKQKAGVS